MSRRLMFLLPPMLLLAACASSTRTASESNLDLAWRWMQGSFTSAAQAQADADFLPISLQMHPLWPQARDVRWLYVEQAMQSALDKPYRQRVYRLSATADGGVASEVFEIADPQRFVRGWERGSLVDLRESDLIPRTGCTVFMRRQGDAFEGATQGRDCLSSLRGASYASAKVRLEAVGLRSWDQGFDAEGKQVWGAVKGPYVFDRRP